MNGVLVLDATWQPERIVSFRRALELLWDGKAQPVSDDIAKIMRSPSIEVEIPSVIRLARIGKWAIAHREAPYSRIGVLVRDEYLCQFVVHERPCSRRATTVDHIHPQTLGGQNSWENVVAACVEHNQTKAARTLDMLPGWAMKREPEAPPRTLRLLRSAGVVEMPPAWVPFMCMT